MLDVSQHISRADTDRHAGRFVEAEAGYLTVIALDPANLRALVGLGLIAKKSDGAWLE